MSVGYICWKHITICVAQAFWSVVYVPYRGCILIVYKKTEIFWCRLIGKVTKLLRYFATECGIPVFRRIACRNNKKEFAAMFEWYGKENDIVGLNFVLK